jgi:uncharacterized protein (DUF2461 family)
MSDTFSGFADAKGSFFRALAKNQNREWFAAHKAEKKAKAEAAKTSAEAKEAETK